MNESGLLFHNPRRRVDLLNLPTLLKAPM